MSEIPTLPLTPNWETTLTETTDVITQQFNPHEARELGTKGLNSVLGELNINIRIRNWGEVEQVLFNRKSLPFYISYDGGTTTEPGLWRCEEYSVVNEGGNQLVQFSATFKEVKRP